MMIKRNIVFLMSVGEDNVSSLVGFEQEAHCSGSEAACSLEQS
jgi:hypothetical protein